MCPSVLSPTPTVPIFLDSTNVTVTLGQSLLSAAAVIQPLEPPPIIAIFLISIKTPSLCISNIYKHFGT